MVGCDGQVRGEGTTRGGEGGVGNRRVKGEGEQTGEGRRRTYSLKVLTI